MKPCRPLTDQSGMVVVVALLVMVVITILGLSFLGSSLTEGQIGSNESDLRKAFFAAEAGIQEAMYRMRLDPAAPLPSGSDEADTPCTATADPVVVGQQGTPATSWADPTSATFWKYNPYTAPTPCSWSYSGSSAAGYGNYFGGSAANLDSAGRTFTSSGSAHAAGGALVSASITNTVSDPRSYTVTVAPVVGFVAPCWQYVDQFGAPLGSCAKVADYPMFKVTSTGIAKNSQKVLSTMIQRFVINPDPKSTLEANTNINVNSASAIIDGRNYDCDGNNPASDNNFPAATSPTGAAGISINKPENLQCDSGAGVTNCGGTSGTFPNSIGGLLLRGNPYVTTTQIDALNAYLESIKVAPAQAPPKDGPPFHGILYVDGDYEMPPDGSTGVLIVHHRDGSNHDVATLGNFDGGTFKGLIIADKINKINGNAEIIGVTFAFGNAADGVTVDDVTGTPNIKYSKCALEKYVPSAFPFQIVRGTWHEQ